MLGRSVRSECPPFIGIHLRAPTLEKDAAASLVTLAGLLGRGDPVGTEGAVALPQLAPGNERAGLVHEAERDRPDDPICSRPARILIVDPQLRLGSDRTPKRRQVDFVDRETPTRRPGQGGWILQRLLRRGRKHRRDLGEGARSGFSQNRVAALIDIAQPQHDRFGLVLAQHERREEETGPQDIADAGLSIDRCTLSGELGDIPIERALRHLQLGRQSRRRHGPAFTPQNLQKRQ
jgi:hypothetical protein